MRPATGRIHCEKPGVVPGQTPGDPFRTLQIHREVQERDISMRIRPFGLVAALALGMAGIVVSGAPATAANCGDQVLVNGGFETGSSPWTATSGVITSATSGEPAHGGTKIGWLDGYGQSHTDTLSQSVTLPAGCTSATLAYWLHIDTNETTTTSRFDTLTAQVGSTTVGSFSNLN